jgi:AraC-like DNA-binding protein
LYDFDVSGASISAWRPGLDGVVEVLHARMTGHAYPMHAHDSWTLLLVDDGAVRYDLDRHERGAFGDLVTLLPPHVPHNGASATPRSFRKRVVYLAPDWLPEGLIGASVDNSAFTDPALHRRIAGLHRLLRQPDLRRPERRQAELRRPEPRQAEFPRAGDGLEAEGELAEITERLRERLGRPSLPERLDCTPAYRLRDLLEEHVVPGLSLEAAARVLHFHPAYLVRSFSRTFGMSPHQYLISRRVDLARRLILAGDPLWSVAPGSGFYDQSHLDRHFKRILGVSPVNFRA